MLAGWGYARKTFVPEPLVHVVLVTWNCREDVEACLSSLQRNTNYPSWRLVVIDNASSDGTREWLRDNAGDAELVLLEENRGWVRSLNLAVSRHPSDYYFFLNPDTVVGPNWLGPLVATMEADREAGFAAPRFLYQDGTIHYAGAFIGRSLSIAVRGHGEADRGQYARGGRVAFAHGQCLARGCVLREIGPYDEGFGLGYFEEADLQLRALRHGYGALYVPESVIVHATAKAFDRHPGGLKEQLLTQNWLRLITMHWPVAWLLLRIPTEMARPLRILARGHDPRPTLRAWRGWLRDLPAALARREVLRKQGSVDWRRLKNDA